MPSASVSESALILLSSPAMLTLLAFRLSARLNHPNYIMFVFLRGWWENGNGMFSFWQRLCHRPYARHYALLRLISVRLIPVAGLTSFVICLPEGSRSQCEKLIFCRRISGGAIAIGVHYITIVHSTSAHQSRINKFFISCCISPIFLQNQAWAYRRVLLSRQWAMGMGIANE